MLQLSRGRGGRRADLHSLAKQWGCKVVTLEELQGELKKLKPLPSSITTITTDVRRSQGIVLIISLSLTHTLSFSPLQFELFAVHS